MIGNYPKAASELAWVADRCDGDQTRGLPRASHGDIRNQAWLVADGRGRVLDQL